MVSLQASICSDNLFAEDLEWIFTYAGMSPGCSDFQQVKVVTFAA
jgi:hypothetical protein